MKNKHFDRKRSAAKLYAKSWHRANKLTPLGNALIHCYETPKKYGWWDDVMFRLGSQVVVVWWVHPRMTFSDETSEMAHDLLPPAPEWNIRANSTPVYKKVGKSRKKTVAYTMAPVHKSFADWCEEWDNHKEQIRRTTDLVIRPSMKVKQLDWCRGVSLCIPEEAVDAASVEKVAEIAKKLLRRETTLEEPYPGYGYTRHDYEHEANSTEDPENWFRLN